MAALVHTLLVCLTLLNSSNYLLILVFRGRFRRKSTWKLLYASRRRVLRSASEQDLSRYVIPESRPSLTFCNSHHPLESVTEPEILAVLKPMIKRYALERLEGERFGDFTIRAGYIAPTTEGRLWYEHSGGEGVNKESAAVEVAAAA